MRAQKRSSQFYQVGGGKEMSGMDWSRRTECGRGSAGTGAGVSKGMRRDIQLPALHSPVLFHFTSAVLQNQLSLFCNIINDTFRKDMFSHSVLSF